MEPGGGIEPPLRPYKGRRLPLTEPGLFHRPRGLEPRWIFHRFVRYRDAMRSASSAEPCLLLRKLAAAAPFVRLGRIRDRPLTARVDGYTRHDIPRRTVHGPDAVYRQCMGLQL